MAIPKLEECKPGIVPKGFNVLVAIEPVEDKIGSVFIPQQSQDKEKLVQAKGRIVALSPAAFDFANFGDDAPKVGDAIQFAKLAGLMTKGADGKDYRLLLDKDIAAVIEEEAWA
jgi:co-chaperonin GroES (HSP10)